MEDRKKSLEYYEAALKVSFLAATLMQYNSILLNVLYHFNQKANLFKGQFTFYD